MIKLQKTITIIVDHFNKEEYLHAQDYENAFLNLQSLINFLKF